MLDINVSDESPCREISKFKISAHLDMGVENGERLIFCNYIPGKQKLATMFDLF